MASPYFNRKDLDRILKHLIQLFVAWYRLQSFFPLFFCVRKWAIPKKYTWQHDHASHTRWCAVKCSEIKPDPGHAVILKCKDSEVGNGTVCRYHCWTSWSSNCGTMVRERRDTRLDRMRLQLNMLEKAVWAGAATRAHISSWGAEWHDDD